MIRVRKAALLLMMLMSFFLLVNALAEEGETVTADDGVMLMELATVEGKPSEKVEIPLSLTNCEAVDSLQFRINYDPAALRLLRVVNGDIFDSEFLVTNPAEKGLIQVAAISAYGLTQEGTMLMLEMELLGASGGSITITEAIATRVDPEAAYEQSKGYLKVVDGGVISEGGSLPAPVTTPWIAETPVPTATPEPTPEPVPESTPVQTNEPLKTPEPEATATPENTATTDEISQTGSSTVALLLAAGAALIILILVLALLNRANIG